MLVGVVKLAPSLPLDGQYPFLHLDRKFMHLGFHIYDVGFQSPNVDARAPAGLRHGVPAGAGDRAAEHLRRPPAEPPARALQGAGTLDSVPPPAAFRPNRSVFRENPWPPSRSPPETSGESRTRQPLDMSKETVALKVENLDLYYGPKQALKKVNMIIPHKKATAFIGPSGCGKSTLLRCFNRMNDLVDGCRVEGAIRFGGQEHLRPRRRHLALAPDHRHGLPEAEPVSEEHLRERRLRASPARREQEARARTKPSSGR